MRQHQPARRGSKTTRRYILLVIFFRVQELPHLAVSSLGNSGCSCALCQDASLQQLTASKLQSDWYVTFSAGFKNGVIYPNRSHYVLSVSLSSSTVSLSSSTVSLPTLTPYREFFFKDDCI